MTEEDKYEVAIKGQLLSPVLLFKAWDKAEAIYAANSLECDKLCDKLNNIEFINKAPEQVVAETKKRLFEGSKKCSDAMNISNSILDFLLNCCEKQTKCYT